MKSKFNQCSNVFKEDRKNDVMSQRSDHYAASYCPISAEFLTLFIDRRRWLVHVLDAQLILRVTIATSDACFKTTYYLKKTRIIYKGLVFQ